MKLKKSQKRVESPPATKPKRLDLNSNQRRVLEKVLALSRSDLSDLMVEVVKWGGSFQPSFCSSQKFFYDPYYVASFLGISPATVDRYTDGFLRIVRREGESARDFRLRKQTFSSPDAPLVSEINSMVGVTPCTYRLISDRIVIFVCLSTTSVRSPDKKLRGLQILLQDMTGISPAKARKIGPLESVRKWDVE